MERNILVTGSNRGIGLAIVEELSKNGQDKIIQACRKPNEVDSIANNVFARRCDLSTKKVLNDCIYEIKEEFGHIDVLINNGAILTQGNFLDLLEEDFEAALQVNVLSPYYLMKEFVSGMVERGYGRVVNISSGWGSFHDGLTGPFAYSFTKASLNALTLTSFKNLPLNVKINSMCPGWVRTQMGGDQAPRTPQKGAETAVWLANLDEKGLTGGFFRDMETIDW